jgi:hypothetical protein
MKAVWLAVAAALLFPGTAGCSAAPEPVGTSAVEDLIPVPAPTVSAVPTIATVQGLTLPTEDFRPTPGQRNIIARATNLKIAECMGEFGFTWASRSKELPAPNQVDRLYGVSDLGTAQRYGYHLPSSGAASSSRSGSSLSVSERLVLSGSSDGSGTSGGASVSYQGKPVPDGGCAKHGRRQAMGVDDIDPERLADTITVEMWKKSKSDPRVVAVIADWSQCMKQAGYTYASPLDAGADRPEWLRADAAGAAEIETAVADVTCKQRTNLIGTWFTIESAYEMDAIQLYREQLNRIRTQWQEAAAIAAQVVDSTSPK